MRFYEIDEPQRTDGDPRSYHNTLEDARAVARDIVEQTGEPVAIWKVTVGTDKKSIIGLANSRPDIWCKDRVKMDTLKPRPKVSAA